MDSEGAANGSSWRGWGLDLGWGWGLGVGLGLWFDSRVLGLGIFRGLRGPDLRKSESSKPAVEERCAGARPREEAKDATSDSMAARSAGDGFFVFCFDFGFGVGSDIAAAVSETGGKRERGFGGQRLQGFSFCVESY